MQVVVRGMTCDDCERHVTSAFRRAGASEAVADWRSGKARIEGEGLSEQKLAAALEGTRYEISGADTVGQTPTADPEAGTRDYDLVVIGSGSAALAAAIRARDWSRRVLLVEHGTPGGTCVNVGCVPSKALLHDSERANGTKLAAAVARKDELVARLRQEKYVELIDDYGVAYREGEAHVIDPHTVEVNGEKLSADAILVAAGAAPAIPLIAGLEEAGYLTSTTAIELSEAPAELAVLGVNAIGLELGQMLANFGSEVTFLDLAERIAPFEEPEISQAMQEILEQDGHRVITSVEITEVAVDGGEKGLRGTADGEPIEVRAGEILVATGRRPNTAGLGLEAVGVELDDRGAVVVDAHQRTSVPSIYAAGDVTMQPQFVYVAAAGGAAAASNALGLGEETLDFDSLPRVTFTSPQIAAAGRTEAEARARGFEVETRVMGLEAVPRALVNGETRGLFKLVAESGTGRLLGVSVLAERAGEVIQSAVLAIKAGMTVGELSSAWAPYLTMAEGLKLAAQTFERDVAKLSCCAA